jgi:hypothetical protein
LSVFVIDVICIDPVYVVSDGGQFLLQRVHESCGIMVSVDVCFLYTSNDSLLAVSLNISWRKFSLLSFSSSRVKFRPRITLLKDFWTSSMSV